MKGKQRKLARPGNTMSFCQKGNFNSMPGMQFKKVQSPVNTNQVLNGSQFQLGFSSFWGGGAKLYEEHEKTGQFTKSIQTLIRRFPRFSFHSFHVIHEREENSLEENHLFRNVCSCMTNLYTSAVSLQRTNNICSKDCIHNYEKSAGETLESDKKKILKSGSWRRKGITKKSIPDDSEKWFSCCTSCWAQRIFPESCERRSTRWIPRERSQSDWNFIRVEIFISLVDACVCYMNL